MNNKLKLLKEMGFFKHLIMLVFIIIAMCVSNTITAIILCVPAGFFVYMLIQCYILFSMIQNGIKSAKYQDCDD